jgi:ribosome-binding factor A
MTDRQEKVHNLIRQLAAKFLQTKTGGGYLISLTDSSITDDMKRVKIFMTVLPDTEEKTALKFVAEQSSDLKDYLKKNMNLKFIPFITFAIDKGEKSRQRFEEALIRSKKEA